MKILISLFHVFYLLSKSFQISSFQLHTEPKKWTTCKKNSPSMNHCLKIAVDAAIHDLLGGNENLGVFPLNPLHFNTLSIDQGTGPVSIKLDFMDLDVRGIDDLKVNKVTNNWKDMELYMNVPTKLVMDGKYKSKGQVLILPITGDGHFTINLNNFTSVANLKFSEKDKGGKIYYNLDSFGFKFDTENMHMHFDNLFNGDKALGDNMNKFLNDNWKTILNELKPAISSAFGAAFLEISNRIFSKIEMDTISPP